MDTDDRGGWASLDPLFLNIPICDNELRWIPYSRSHIYGIAVSYAV